MSGIAFDWDEGNVEKLRLRHGIEPYEVEEAIADNHGIGMPVYNRNAERRFGWLGETEDGRLLFVVFTRRGGGIRPLSARDGQQEERRRYRRNRK